MSEMTIKKHALPKATPLINAILAVQQAEVNLKIAGVDLSVLNPVRDELRRRMEDLPIVPFDREQISRHRPIMFFILAGDEWWPAQAGHEADNDWLNYRIDYNDGSCDSGPSRRLHWAQCTADETVNYHWLEPVEPKVPTEPEIAPAT